MLASAPIHGSENLDVAHQASNNTKPRVRFRCLASAYRAGRLDGFHVIVGQIASPSRAVQ